MSGIDEMTAWARECIADFNSVVGPGLDLEISMPGAWVMQLRGCSITTMSFDGVKMNTNDTPFYIRYGELIIRTKNDLDGDVDDTDGVRVTYHVKRYRNESVRQFQLRVDGKDDYFE